MERGPERYSLSPDALQKIYETRVSPRLFRGVESVERPTAIVLGGQPGSGKTPMQNDATREFAGSGGMVKIIGDDLRAFLPHYKGLQRADDKTAAIYTDRDSGRLVEKAIAEAAQRKVNVLVEGTMRNPEKVAATLQRFRDAGFRTDARVLAVSPELSSLGILQRYAAQVESRGHGRMTTREAHQAALDGMPKTLDRIQDERLADRLTLYRRGGEVIKSFDLAKDAAPQTDRASELLKQEHNRPLDPEQKQHRQQELQRLTPILRKHGVLPAQPSQQKDQGREQGSQSAPQSQRSKDRDR